MPKLSHFNAKGDAHMVDVSEKPATARIARASGRIKMSPETLETVKQNTGKKGDVLGVARLAGIMAAKQTAALIPLCHPLPVTHAAVEFDLDPAASEIVITSEIRTTGQTGVEMEALTAVSIAALTVFDMLKAVDRAMSISGIRVILKDGGKSGRHEAD